jgi:hypothetical protein
MRSLGFAALARTMAVAISSAMTQIERDLENQILKMVILCGACAFADTSI